MGARDQVQAAVAASMPEHEDWMQHVGGFANTSSLVNYAKAPMGAKKYDAASLAK
jgi:hypothetical protein